jgi:hypothetical protein
MIMASDSWGLPGGLRAARHPVQPTPVQLGVQPGDWFVVDPGDWLSADIKLGERLIDGSRTKYAHAGMASRWDHQTGQLMIVQAEPGGAQEVPWPWQGRDHAWSTGRYPANGQAAVVARGLIGTPYSFADYAAIALHTAHVPAPGLRSFISAGGHLICSQLVDHACLVAGTHLFADGRWEGYVKPSDLGRLLGVVA